MFWKPQKNNKSCDVNENYSCATGWKLIDMSICLAANCDTVRWNNADVSFYG
jgi:hypothetical protein